MLIAPKAPSSLRLAGVIAVLLSLAGCVFAPPPPPPPPVAVVAAPPAAYYGYPGYYGYPAYRRGYSYGPGYYGPSYYGPNVGIGIHIR